MSKGKNRKHFWITMVIGLVIAVGVYAIRDGSNLTDWPSRAAALCDACFVPAALLLCVGALMFVSNDGLFDMLGYGVQKALTIVLREEKRAKYPKTFLEYKQMKWDAPKTSFGFLLLAGLIYLLLAFVFLFCSGALG